MSRILRYIFWFTCSFFLLGFFGESSWFCDFFSHFRMYYLVTFIILFASFLLYKRYRYVLSSGLVIIFILITVMEYYQPVTHHLSSNEKIKIATVNLWAANENYEAVRNYLVKEKFNLVVFQEVTRKWENELKAVFDKYQFNISVPREDNYGIGLISNLRVDSLKVEKWSNFGFPTIRCRLPDYNNSQIIGTHSYSPEFPYSYNDRNFQFQKINELAKEVEKEGNPLIILGDLNCTIFSPNFNLLKEGTSLRDACLGFGLRYTWSNLWKIFKIQIDHILVSDGISVLEIDKGKNIGSDHFPLEAIIQIK